MGTQWGKGVPTMIATTARLAGNRFFSQAYGCNYHGLALYVIVRSAHQLQRSRQFCEQFLAELRIDVEKRRTRELVGAVLPGVVASALNDHVAWF
jgi:hypothetical protein